MTEPSDRLQAASDARRLLGRVVSGRYRIEALIGEGGMGSVYRAVHTQTNKRLAVKVLHPVLLFLDDVVERFRREAIAGAHIDHPNVAGVIDFGRLDDGSHFLVLEFLEGEDLDRVIERGPLLPLDRSLRIVRQIALALSAAHRLGIVHRDLKPGNVMLVKKQGEDELVKVFDFGIAKVPAKALASAESPATPPVLTQLGMVYGTPEYMAPEQALGEAVDGRADLYALGVVFYEMLCGKRPFEAASRASLLGIVATRRPPPIRQRVPGTVVPAEVEAIVMRLLEKDPAARFHDAEGVIEAIDVAMLELDIPLSATRAPRRAASDPDRSAARGSASERHEAAPSPAAPPAAQAPAPAPVPEPQLQPAPEPEPEEDDGERPSELAGDGVRPRGFSRRVVVIAAAAAAALLIVSAVSRSREVTTGALLPASASAVATAPAPVAPAPPAPAPVDPPAVTVAPGPTAPPEPAPAPETTASAEELDEAKTRGLVALGPLALRYPGDGAVLRALMLAHAARKSGYLSAVRVAKRLMEVDPAAIGDDEVRWVLFKAASGPPEVSTAAFDVMANHMGSRGPDLIYDLVTAPSVGRFTRQRATRALAGARARELASPALRIADDLRIARRCATIEPLLSRARTDGDIRALHHLAPLRAAPCPASRARPAPGTGECNRCPALHAAAVAAATEIEKREKR